MEKGPDVAPTPSHPDWQGKVRACLWRDLRRVATTVLQVTAFGDDGRSWMLTGEGWKPTKQMALDEAGYILLASEGGFENYADQQRREQVEEAHRQELAAVRAEWLADMRRLALALVEARGDRS